MVWFLITPVVLLVLAVLWFCALMVHETRTAYTSRAAADRALTDPKLGPVQPFRALITFWIHLTQPNQ